MATSVIDRKRTRDALKVFRAAWDRSSEAFQTEFSTRKDVYSIYWAYYANTMFADGGWNVYKSQTKLYRSTRPLYNPAARLADFYATSIYPGVLSLDGGALPEGMPLAIPLADDTDDTIREALGQLWQWTNWQSGKELFVLFGAVFGSVLLEVVDDVEREKVLIDIVKPDKVEDIVLDGTGNVKAYALEYMSTWPILDDSGHPTKDDIIRFRKEVDADEFRYFKNDKPFLEYPGGPVQDNPYGFCPATWVRHRNMGTTFGAPAIEGIVTKIDEMNSLGAHTLDQIHKVIGTPILIAGEGKVSNLTDVAKRRTTSTEEEANIDAVPSENELLLILKAAAGTNVAPLVGNLSIADATAALDKILEEVEQDRPELVMWRQLREMQQVSAPGAMKLLGDVTPRVSSIAAQYDLQYTKIEQMRLAIAGWRIQQGDWVKRDSQQDKFRSFNLESYERGELDFDILPRPLVVMTNNEKWTDVGLLMSALSTAKLNGIPVPYFMKRFLNWSDEDVTELESAMNAAQVEADDRAVTMQGRQAAASVMGRIGDPVGDVEQ